MKINKRMPPAWTLGGSGGKISAAMKRFIIIALAIAMHLCVKAQHTPLQWFSAQGGSNGMFLNFNGGLNAQVINNPQQTSFITTSAAIGGADSNLLFYTNGTAIYNNLHLKI